LPEETDGIYFLISGRAKLVNTYDNFEMKNFNKCEIFGEHKYIYNRGFSYYGDLFAMGH
jgi:hypothetical protein